MSELMPQNINHLVLRKLYEFVGKFAKLLQECQKASSSQDTKEALENMAYFHDEEARIQDWIDQFLVNILELNMESVCSLF
jgi:hypothetical protein